MKDFKQELSLYQAFKEGALIDVDAPAILYMKKIYTYKCMLENVDKLASALYSYGIKKNDIVTVCLPNIPQCAYLVYALNKIGAKSHIVHALLSNSKFLEMHDVIKSKMLFVMDTRVNEFLPDCVKNNIDVVSCSPVQDLNPIIKTVYRFSNKKDLKSNDLQIKNVDEMLQNSTDNNNNLCNSVIDNTKESLDNKQKNFPKCLFDYKEFLELYYAKELNLDENELCLNPEDDAVILNSGGTLGEPKNICLSSKALNTLAVSGSILIGTSDVSYKYMMSALPLFHGFGLSMGLHAMVMHNGCNVFMPKFTRKIAIGYILDNKINYMIGVPAIYSALLTVKKFKGKALKNIKIAFVGGDFVPPKLLKEFNKVLIEAGSNGRLFEGYGLTETVAVCSANTIENNRLNSVGKAVEKAQIRAFCTPKSREYVLQCEQKNMDSNSSKAVVLKDKGEDKNSSVNSNVIDSKNAKNDVLQSVVFNDSEFINSKDIQKMAVDDVDINTVNVKKDSRNYADCKDIDLKEDIENREKNYGKSKFKNVFGLVEKVFNKAQIMLSKISKSAVSKVVNMEENTLCDYGIDGELCVSGDTVMNGYYHDDDSNKQVFFTDKSGVKWLKTGDWGCVDSDGYVYFKQRIKSIVKVSGVAVFPSELECLVSSAYGVEKVSAFGVSDEKTGEIFIVAIELTNKEFSLQEQAQYRAVIEKMIKETLPKYYFPKEIIFIDSMPLTKMNKIDVESLKQIYSNGNYK